MAKLEIDMAGLRESFLDEANEHVSELERGLLELEEGSSSPELLNQIFRAAHSLKGGSGSFDFQSVARFTHALENLLDPLRQGKLAFAPALAELLLRSVDVLKALLEAARTRGPEPADCESLRVELEQYLSNSAAAPEPHDSNLAAEIGGAKTYEVKFKPGRELFQQGMDPVLLLRNLAELGDITHTELDLSALPSLDELDPELCYLAWTVFLSSAKSVAEIRDVFAFVEDSSEIGVRAIFTEWPSNDGAAPAASAEALTAQPEGAAQSPERPAPLQAGKAATATLRVATDKVDKLVDLVGELVIAQSMVAQALAEPSKDGFVRAQEALAEMERNTRELQERVMAVRMIPIGTIFSRFGRLVRDLGAKCNKLVRLETSGQEIEIDKSIVEQLADPITHLMRNALDHGLESPAERAAAGKPEEGVIRLSAAHEAGSVIVELADDGRGLNTARIREKGIALGMIRESDELSEDQIHALIFEPGFSTAPAVTDVSGRGVGMDVVRRNVDALNGSLTVSSVPGAGARVRIKLPLTLAIMDGLTLRVGSEVFLLPLLPIVESIRPTRQQLKSVMGSGEIVRVRDESIPLVRLYQVLGVEPEETDPLRALVVIVEAGTTKLGLLIDELLGQAQVVVKSLELNYRRVDGVMGATILGTGRVALILDVEALARRVLAGSRNVHLGRLGERGATALERARNEGATSWR